MRSPKQILAVAALMAASSCYLPPAYSAQPVLTGAIAEERVKDLTTQINWHDNLKEAEADSQKSGKLIFWIHILGHIDGAT